MLETATPAHEPSHIRTAKCDRKGHEPQSATCFRASAVSRTLSNTAETKPRPKTVGHAAAERLVMAHPAQVQTKRRPAWSEIRPRNPLGTPSPHHRERLTPQSAALNRPARSENPSA